MNNFLCVAVVAVFFCLYVFLVVWDFRSKPVDLLQHSIRIRLLSGIVFLLLTAVWVAFSNRSGEIMPVLWFLAVADVILTLHPVSYEKAYPSWLCAVVTGVVAFSAAVVLSLVPGGISALAASLALIVCASSAIYLAYRCRKRFRRVRTFFSANAVWHNIEDSSRLVFHSLLMSLCCLLAISGAISGVAGLLVETVAGVSLLALYGLLYYRAVSGRSLLLKRSQEEYVNEALKGNLRDSHAENAEDDLKMNKLYKRILQYMDTHQPYLVESFSLDDLSGSLYSNKVYLSKTINLMSGRNFRQFVNYYRVNYSIELMKGNPRMKIQELSTMSGFHNVVSYNQSFRLFMGESPGEYLHKLQLSLSGI